MSTLIILLTIVVITNGAYTPSRTYTGTDVNIEEVPFIVAVAIYQKRSKTSQVCTGFLVDVRWVVTAAHCVIDIPLSGITVRLGATMALLPEKEITVDKVIINTKYMNTLRWQSDVALLKLSKTVEMSEYSQLIEVDNKGWPNNTLKRHCFIAGYGYHREHLLPELHGGPVTVGKGVYYDVENCPDAYYADKGYWFYPNESTPTCFGDSGAPVVCNNVAIAVVFGAQKCESKFNISCENKKVDLYISVYEHFKWMESYIGCLPHCNSYFIIKPTTMYIALLVFICLNF